MISFVSFCWFTSAQKQKHKIFLRDHSGNKATQLFCVIPAIPPRIYILYIQFFDCRFIWKSYVNFSFIEFIFVMVKDTYLLTYLWIILHCRIHQIFFLAPIIANSTIRKPIFSYLRLESIKYFMNIPQGFTHTINYSHN